MKSVIFLLVAALVMASCGGDPESTTQYTVTYYANGESVTVPPVQKAAAGSTVYVAALQGEVPAGKIFDGWNTQADGDGDLYTPGGPLVVDKDIDLYAGWGVSGNRTEIDDYTVKMEPYSNFDLYIDWPLEKAWGQVCQPDWDGERIVSGGSYTVTYSFKSDIAISYVGFDLADASGITGKSVVRLDGAGYGNEYTIPPNTERSGEFRFLSTSNAANSSELANSIFVDAMMSEAGQQPTLTFTKLTLQKDEIVNVSVSANGSPGVKTSQLTFTFDRPVTGLTAGNFNVGPGSTWNYNISITKGDLHGSGWIYTLDISLIDNSIDPSDITIEINANVSKPGYAFIGNTQANENDRNGVARSGITAYSGIAPPPPPPPRIVFNSVTANGSFSQNTTELTLTFSEPIVGLTANDIVAMRNGVLVTKGSLSSGSSPGTYILPIGGFATGGTLGVSVSKTGYTISGSPKTTTIYLDYNGTPPYEGFLGHGYDVLNSPYYLSDKVTTQPALDMRKLKAEGKVIRNSDNFRETSTVYIVGESLSKYAKDFSVKAGLSASAGFFSASAGFGYSSSSQIETHSSFASCVSELIKVKEYLDLGTISIANIRANYLLDNFKNNWLLNPGVTPTELFRNYGTHIFLEVYLGGRMDMSFVYKNEKKENSTAITANLKASYATVSGYVDTAINKQAEEFVSNSDDKIKSYGGTEELDFSSFANAKHNYAAWASSIEYTDNLALIKGGRLDTITQMLPIWELIDQNASAANRTRYEQLKGAFNEQLTANGKFFMELQQNFIHTYVKNIYMGAHRNEDSAKSDLWSQAGGEDVTILNGSLNKDAPGKDYIFLGYTGTDTANEAITDIKAVNSGTNFKPRSSIVLNGITYYQFGCDANQGVSGDYIWLYYTKNTNAGKPIKDLFVEIEGDIEKMAGTGWTRVKWTGGGDADMNKGNSGKIVYIWMQR